MVASCVGGRVGVGGAVVSEKLHKEMTEKTIMK